ncbi:beta-glucan synthesis-associated [Mycena sanguinolenta]|nr:beta-glucan synthesis-associated [Mycena sanguinolenta]
MAEPMSPGSPSNPESQPLQDSHPSSPTQTTPFLPETNGSRAPGARSPSFVSSPLNPQGTTSVRPNSRPVSRGSSMHFFSRFPSDETAPSPYPFSRDSTLSATPLRGSMILYRLADDDSDQLAPPRALGASNRSSVASLASIASESGDSKYPSGMPSPRGLVAYAYDPASDELDGPDEEDWLHDPSVKGKDGYQVAGRKFRHRGSFPWRGVANVGVLIIVTLALLALFISYPVVSAIRGSPADDLAESNILVNKTGQVADLPNIPALIDATTPSDAHTRTGFDGQSYTLVFSDEFSEDGRTFYPGDDPYWEAVDLWYGNTADLEWYDPSQIITRDGHLVITMDSTSTTSPHQTTGSTAPFTVDENHNQQYRSGMLQSWNKFCFTRGYIEVAIVLPGPDANTQGYWPGAWTMGNLARPGYTASTDGAWPYTYSSCDVGTFPNQTLADGSGPAAALRTDAGQEKYNYELSWLSGQKLSACSCPGSDHPGPAVTVGRGAPEIDILEAEKDKVNAEGQVVSQSAQFAPFTANYNYLNANADEWTVYNPAITRANTYKGSAVQQALSALTDVPATGFQGSGKQLITYGFEYWSDPSDPTSGFITWQVNGTESARMGAAAVGPDQGDGGSGVGQRLIPVEPMSIVLNLGISSNWQTIDLTTMVFPAEMLVDYVRVYQRDGETNIGCDPPDYPTADYITNHYAAYSNPNLTQWQWDKPKNSLYSGGC